MGFIPPRPPPRFLTIDERREKKRNLLTKKAANLWGLDIQDLWALAYEEKLDQREYLLNEQYELLKEYRQIEFKISNLPF
jgi:hypothetical protein